MSLSNYSPDLRKPKTTEALAKALGVSTSLFKMIAEKKDPEILYRLHRIRKRSRRPTAAPTDLQEKIEALLEPRSLSLPSPDQYRYAWESIAPQTKLAHKSVSATLYRFVTAYYPDMQHPNAYGYVRGRSTRDHARRHLGATYLLSADIENFFPNISIGKVEVALRKIGIRNEVSNILAKFLTIENSLPLGLNSSPLIANIVAHPIDVEFTQIAERIGCTYTRYADDLTFSGNGALLTEQSVEEILEKHGFKANRSKFRRSRRGQRHYVTGLSVSDPSQPHAPKTLKKRLRQELYYISKFGLANHIRSLQGAPSKQSTVNRIDGMVNYVSSIEPKLSYAIRSQWDSICIAEEVKRSFTPRPYINLRESLWLIDESEVQKEDGTRLLVLGCVELDKADARAVEGKISDLVEQEKGDAFSPNGVTNLHWTESNWTQRDRLVDVLRTSPIRCLIALDKFNGKSYETVYTTLLKRLIDSAMRRADDSMVEIIVEANPSKISAQKVESSILEAYRRLVNNNERRSLSQPKIEVLKKNSRPAMVIPDAILGIFTQYAKHKKSDRGLGPDFLNFEKIRGKYALIADLNEGNEFHRRNPFTSWALRPDES